MGDRSKNWIHWVDNPPKFDVGILAFDKIEGVLAYITDIQKSTTSKSDMKWREENAPSCCCGGKGRGINTNKNGYLYKLADEWVMEDYILTDPAKITEEFKSMKKSYADVSDTLTKIGELTGANYDY